MGVDTDHRLVVYGGSESFPTRHGKVLDFDSLDVLEFFCLVCLISYSDRPRAYLAYRWRVLDGNRQFGGMFCTPELANKAHHPPSIS